MLENNKLISAKEAASYLGVTEGTLSVWRTTHRYHIKYVKIGHLIKYRISDLEAWIHERTRLGSKGAEHE